MFYFLSLPAAWAFSTGSRGSCCCSLGPSVGESRKRLILPGGIPFSSASTLNPRKRYVAQPSIKDKGTYNLIERLNKKSWWASCDLIRTGPYSLLSLLLLLLSPSIQHFPSGTLWMWRSLPSTSSPANPISRFTICLSGSTGDLRKS